jgi:LmbE family N-acetylglucosaminyl deacetylase
MRDRSADILIVVAHPDDAEFGAAGSVAKWTGEGRRVAYIVCTGGEKGTSDRSLTPQQLVGIRKREQRDAANLLGVAEVVFLDFNDQELEDTPDFRKAIVRQIRRYRPRTVVTSDPYRRYIWHRDHRIVGQVALDAIFPYARDFLAYPDLIDEGLEPHKVAEILFFAAEEVNFRVDITATFDKKLAALLCHKSQTSGFPTEDPASWLRDRCREMAAGEPYELAEAFYRVEAPK